MSTQVSCIDDTGKLAMLGLRALIAEPGYCLRRCREIQVPQCVVITMCMHAPAVFFLRRPSCCYVPAKIEGWILSMTSRFGRQRAYSFVHARTELGFLRVRSGGRDLSLAICNGKQRILGNRSTRYWAITLSALFLRSPCLRRYFSYNNKWLWHGQQ